MFNRHPLKKRNMEYYTSLTQNAEIRAVAFFVKMRIDHLISQLQMKLNDIKT